VSSRGWWDRVICAVALVVLAPALAVIALTVKLSSPGPVIFRQVRVGQDGQPFVILKFRTMHIGSDRGTVNVSPAGDPRVTRVGRFLRSSHLDELPQLVNVVRGDMRLVGPRPETPEFVARYDADQRRVLEVKPGFVGPSTLAFMDEAELLAKADDPARYYEDVLMHERVRVDLRYLEERSAAYDMRLLARHAAALLLRR
jgi:lipopolysaccharide/colanic/teichoic acid biosynthesis glycosyltransferase